MEKLVLKDGTTISSVTNVTDNSFTTKMTAEEMVTTFDCLNQKNLSRFELQSVSGDVMSVFIDKAPKSCSFENGVATFTLRNVDTIEKRITSLEESVDDLVSTVLMM